MKYGLKATTVPLGFTASTYHSKLRYSRRFSTSFTENKALYYLYNNNKLVINNI